MDMASQGFACSNPIPNFQPLSIEPNRERLVARGRFDQPNRTRSPAWTHPVIANGKWYVRDQDLLLCYNIKAK